MNIMDDQLLGKTVLVRGTYSGVFFGTLKKQEDKSVWLTNARRIHFWAGAATLSEIALRGVKRPEECQIPDPVPHIFLLDIVEMTPMSDDAIASLEQVQPWRA